MSSNADGCNNNQDALLVLLLPAHYFATADLHADWLRWWLEETPTHRIILVLNQSRFLPDLFQRCQNKDNSSSSFQAGSAEVRTIVVVNAGDKTNLQKLQAVLHTQSLSVLSSLLIHLRAVRMFPWNEPETEITPLPPSLVL